MMILPLLISPSNGDGEAAGSLPSKLAEDDAWLVNAFNAQVLFRKAAFDVHRITPQFLNAAIASNSLRLTSLPSVLSRRS